MKLMDAVVTPAWQAIKEKLPMRTSEQTERAREELLNEIKRQEDELVAQMPDNLKKRLSEALRDFEESTRRLRM